MAKLNPDRFGVTAVVTSCSRHDLLDITLSSFFKHNQFPLANLIVVEDGEFSSEALARKYRSKNVEWIETGKRVGQIAAIDYAYSRVTTPYIFHMEDDWEFYRPGFISKSMLLLQKHRSCLMTWLRALDDRNSHPLEPEEFHDLDVSWRRLSWDYTNEWGVWHGFAFNPGLRRKSDYVLTGGYGHLARFDPASPGRSESIVGQFYRAKEFYAAILSENGGRGFVRHIGGGRHVEAFAACGGNQD